MKGPAVSMAATLVLIVVLVCQLITKSTAVNQDIIRIIGGQDAMEGQFPWQVIFTEKELIYCGGAIIDNLWVLTAGHCVDNEKEVGMWFGVLRRREMTLAAFQRSAAIIVHEKIDEMGVTGFFKNDIALIKLSRPLSWHIESISPIKLPRRSQQSDLFHGEIVVVSGWGDTKTDNSPSNNPVPTVHQFVELEVDVVDACTEDHFICTRAGHRSPFVSDSGGPLVWKDKDGNHRLIGVVSQAEVVNETEPGQIYIQNAFTSVPYYLDWIVEKTGIVLED